jgi:hypothetical protein
MAYGWEGERVRLVPLDKEKHAASTQLWMNDPDMTETILSGDMPLTRVAEDDFFDRMCAPLLEARRVPRRGADDRRARDVRTTAKNRTQRKSRAQRKSQTQSRNQKQSKNQPSL